MAKTTPRSTPPRTADYIEVQQSLRDLQNVGHAIGTINQMVAKNTVKLPGSLSFRIAELGLALKPKLEAATDELRKLSERHAKREDGKLVPVKVRNAQGELEEVPGSYELEDAEAHAQAEREMLEEMVTIPNAPLLSKQEMLKHAFPPFVFQFLMPFMSGTSAGGKGPELVKE